MTTTTVPLYSLFSMSYSLATILLLMLVSSRKTQALDVFCGELEIFEQQRFGKDSVSISTQQTDDLKACLELCCGIPNCEGVTFNGVILSHQSQPNCLLVSCRRQCQLNPPGEYNDGVISVLLKRNAPRPDNNTTSVWIPPDTISDGSFGQSSSMLPMVETPAPSIMNTVPMEVETTTTVTKEGSAVALAPVWAVGLAIVIAVVCVGLNLSLLSAYICYRRRQSRKRKAQITTNTGPTLHAFNPAL